jgi:hypothetical protein
MTEWFTNLPGWYFILLAVGVFDALLQYMDYRHWRKHRESEDFPE